MNVRQFVRELFANMKRDWYLPVTEHQIYSDTETVIGTYMGKPLYRKVVECGALPNNTRKTVASGLTDVSVISARGFAFSDTNTLNIPHTSTTVADSVDCSYNKADSTIVITTGMDRSNFATSYIILEYTKNTDTATTSKVPFEPLTEYSTEERMIGYWIDGKPLYRKVVDFGILPNIATKKVTAPIENIGIVSMIYGSVSNTQTRRFMPLPTVYNQDPATNQIRMEYNNGEVIIETRAAWNNWYAYIILQYTKTTD